MAWLPDLVMTGFREGWPVSIKAVLCYAQLLKLQVLRQLAAGYTRTYLPGYRSIRLSNFQDAYTWRGGTDRHVRCDGNQIAA